MFLAHFVENLNLFHMEVSKLEGMKNDQNVLVSTVYFPFLLRGGSLETCVSPLLALPHRQFTNHMHKFILLL